MNPMRLFAEKPWLFFWLGFVVLISAWSILIYLAATNQPQAIPVY